MKKPLAILILLLLAVILSAGCIQEPENPYFPSMIGFIIWEYEDIPNKDEPYSTIVLTEEIHKEYPELAALIYGEPGYEIGVTTNPKLLESDHYISQERADELWYTFGYDDMHLASNIEEHHVLSENGKLYCLIKTFV